MSAAHCGGYSEASTALEVWWHEGAEAAGRPACKRWRAAAAPGLSPEGCLTINCLPDELMLKVDTLCKCNLYLNSRFLTASRRRPGQAAFAAMRPLRAKLPGPFVRPCEGRRGDLGRKMRQEVPASRLNGFACRGGAAVSPWSSQEPPQSSRGITVGPGLCRLSFVACSAPVPFRTGWMALKHLSRGTVMVWVRVNLPPSPAIVSF